MAQKEKNKSRIIFVFSIFVLGIIFVCLPASKVFALSNTTGFAWSDRLGWINFGCASCTASVTDSAVTGYVWSPNYGWINLSPSNASCTADINCGVKNTTSGVLSGDAWGENTGWINFSGVSIVSSGSSEYFTGTASGNVAGTVNFSCPIYCNVSTAWTPSVTCGDGICNGTETCTTCPADCGTCGGGGGPVLGHTECDYAIQQCKSLSTGTASNNTCTANSDCICDPHGDFNHDGKVNLTDFSIMMYFWKTTPASAHWSPCVDLNHSLLVEIHDFSIMLYWWTK